MSTINGVLVAYSYGCIAGSKRDGIITKEITEAKNAGEDAGMWSNKLFPASTCQKRNTFTELRRHLGQMRQFHYENTYVFEDEMWRILPEKRQEAYRQVVEIAGKERADEMLENFINDLPNLIDLARLARGNTFKDSDYPTVEQIRAKFSYKVSYRPIPTSAGLDPARYEAAIAEINALHARRLQEANQALIERFMKPFQNLAEQLAEPGHRKLKPVMESIAEFVDLVPSLDLSGNQELQALALQVKEKFADITPDMIRKDEEVQKFVGNTASSVIAALQGFGAVGQRKFA